MQRPILAFAGLLLILAQHSGAAESPTADTRFADRIEVAVAEIEVHVEDRDGETVESLGRDDFRLLIDGRPVEILDLGRRTDGSSTPTASEDAAEVSVDPPTAVGAEDEALTLAIYIDEANLLPQGRPRLFAALADFVSGRLGEGSSAMVLRFTRNLEVVVPPTDDGDEIRRGLERLTRSSTALPASLGSEQELLSRIQYWVTSTPFAPGGANGASTGNDCHPDKLAKIHTELRGFAEDREAEVLAALGATSHTVSTLAPLRGRKVLVYVADHLPHRPGHRAYEYLRQLCPPTVTDTRYMEIPNPRIPNFLTRVGAQAAAAGVVFYAFQPSALRLPGATDASVVVHTGGAAIATARWDDEDTLFSLASDTGGRAFLHGADFTDSLAALGRDLDTGYTLTFDAAALDPGELHRVEVEVVRPGTRVRHRQRLRLRTPEERSHDQVLAALQAGTDGLPGELGAKVEVGSVTAIAKKLFEVSLWLRIPLSELVFVSHGEREQAQLSLTVTAEDGRGHRTPTRAVIVPIELSSRELAAKQGGDFLYELKTHMRRGEHRLALRVEDVATGAAEVVAVELTVPAGG